MQFRSATAIFAASCTAATGQPGRLALAGGPRKATKIFSVIWSVATVPPAAAGLPDIPLAGSVAALRVERKRSVAFGRSLRSRPAVSIHPPAPSQSLMKVPPDRTQAGLPLRLPASKDAVLYPSTANEQSGLP